VQNFNPRTKFDALEIRLSSFFPEKSFQLLLFHRSLPDENSEDGHESRARRSLPDDQKDDGCDSEDEGTWESQVQEFVILVVGPAHLLLFLDGTAFVRGATPVRWHVDG